VSGDRIARARRVLEVETKALAALRERVDARFGQAIDLLLACRGKVVVTGVGKSGIVCRKIAATLASTGTSAFFLHAGEASHGDLGMLTREDVMLAASNSGETDELVRLLPLVRRFGVPLIALVGRPDSTLGRAADVALDVSVPEEACALGLAPTSSTTATMAMGDALAVALLEERGFGTEDFALLHPGGALGRRLLRVDDVMQKDAALPVVVGGASLPETVLEVTAKGLGMTAVVDERGALLGIVTDGDLRRGLEKSGDIRELTATQLMTANPKTVAGDALAAQALALMERHKITSLVILDGERRPVGVVHLHDLLRAGIV